MNKTYQITIEIDIVPMGQAPSQAFFENMKAQMEQHCQSFQMTEISEMKIVEIVEIEAE